MPLHLRTKKSISIEVMKQAVKDFKERSMRIFLITLARSINCLLETTRMETTMQIVSKSSCTVLATLMYLSRTISKISINRMINYTLALLTNLASNYL